MSKVATARAITGLINDLTDEELLVLTQSEIRRDLKGFLAEMRKKISPAIVAYTVMVNHGQSLEDMIVAGRYDWVNDEITSERFPLEGTDIEELEFQLVHFDRRMSTEQVLAEFGWLGLRPAKIEELLAFGVVHPELQREFPIAALGSSCVLSDGSRHVVCLNEDGVERRLRLHFVGSGWLGDWRFLAVRK